MPNCNSHYVTVSLPSIGNASRHGSSSLGRQFLNKYSCRAFHQSRLAARLAVVAALVDCRFLGMPWYHAVMLSGHGIMLSDHGIMLLCCQAKAMAIWALTAYCLKHCPHLYLAVPKVSCLTDSGTSLLVHWHIPSGDQLVVRLLMLHTTLGLA